MIEVRYHEHPQTRDQLGENLAAAAFLAWRADGVVDDDGPRDLERFAALPDGALAALLEGASVVARVFGAMIYFTDTVDDLDDLAATARQWARAQGGAQT